MADTPILRRVRDLVGNGTAQASAGDRHGDSSVRKLGACSLQAYDCVVEFVFRTGHCRSGPNPSYLVQRTDILTNLTPEDTTKVFRLAE